VRKLEEELFILISVNQEKVDHKVVMVDSKEVEVEMEVIEMVEDNHSKNFKVQKMKLSKERLLIFNKL
jgi:hypothetical protein